MAAAATRERVFVIARRARSPSRAELTLGLGLALLLLGLLGRGAEALGPIVTPTPNTTIYMLPEVFEGLLVAAALIFFALLGICCVLGIQSPDVLHSTTLPAGKEF